ncbi:MAG: YfiR family protein [Fulvivirga sp.]
MRRFYLYFLLLVFSTSLASYTFGQQQVEAAALKSAWLEHFTKFIEWPNITDSTSHFLITVLGQDNFDGYLDRIYAQRKIKNRPVLIKYINAPEEINDCHILFISSNMKKHLSSIINLVNAKPILTVSDESGFAEQGVMINFYKENNRLSFEINISNAQSSELDMSFRLLELAKIVRKNE